MKTKQTTSKDIYMTKRIGSTTYRVKVFFNPKGQESMEDKIIRMIRNEGGVNGCSSGANHLQQANPATERNAQS